ncbi:hypothetical protein LAZ67_20001092 [Cordylochernes scorpioides]|uniref:Uncharacterized protein n=1 Tax=Cordylochernes scorpioides TaxID=51811 RepID=A0ABY6LNH1_9ARAC|nr:hypothetical protein LAZ67_20001092 [Cordylochernes scorpioides]
MTIKVSVSSPGVAFWRYSRHYHHRHAAALLDEWCDQRLYYGKARNTVRSQKNDQNGNRTASLKSLVVSSCLGRLEKD